ncbi:MAG: PF20097 family protein [Actinomycetota bacterium]|nr:PF20097 family protein [Actinomycetota bacterium]
MPHSRVAEIADSEKTCPRCGGQMEAGFLNAGKGPFRWVERPKQHKTIFGGEHLAVQQWIWGRHVIPGARCPRCRFGVFAYDEK